MNLDKWLMIAFSWWPRVAVAAGVLLAGGALCKLT